MPAGRHFKIPCYLIALGLACFAGASSYAAAPGCIGFAAVDGDSSQGMLLTGGTVGGAGGTAVTVSTQAQLETALDQSGPMTILVNGLIALVPYGTTEKVPSDTTLLGMGCGSGIVNGPVVMDNVSNVILQNLILGQSYVPGDPQGTCCNWDAITIWHSSHHVWVDHCDLSHAEDGLCDITDQANYVTVSWCHFHDHNKASLVGRSDSATSDSGYLKVTYHHNWFDHVWINTPRFRFGMGHLFNNYFSHVTQYCAWDTMAGQMVVESNNYGVSAVNPFVIGTPTPTYQPLLSAANNLFDPTATGSQDTFGTPFSPATFYSYSPDSPSMVPTEAVSGTGPCGLLAPTPTPVLAASPVWRIRAGGPSFTDSLGNVWAADTQFGGGYGYAFTTATAIAGTSDAGLYQTERYGNLFSSNAFSYVFPVPPGNYQVTLKFAETDFTASGRRAFNVVLNGNQVLSNFDVYADAGGADKADDKVFNNITPVGGQILAQFNPGNADSPKINALQVIPQPPIPTPTPSPTPPAPNGRPYVYSNPATGPMVHFVYNMSENGTALIRVWNASGQLAASIRDGRPSGQQQSDLDIRAFAPGHYFYQVELKYDSGRQDHFAAEVLAVEK